MELVPRKHQEIAIEFLRRNNRAGVLIDMGLG